MLNRVEFPLTKNQIGDFILEKEYTTFLTLQQAISELIETNMIIAKTIGNRTHLAICEEGQNVLQYFGNRISDAIKAEVCDYLKEHKLSLRNENTIQAQYYKSTSGEYDVVMMVKEKELELINLKISVPTEDIAISICDNWQIKYQTIYEFLTSELF